MTLEHETLTAKITPLTFLSFMFVCRDRRDRQSAACPLDMRKNGWAYISKIGEMGVNHPYISIYVQYRD